MSDPGNQEGNLLGRVDDIAERKRAEAVSDQRARELAALQALGLAVSASLSLKQISTEVNPSSPYKPSASSRRRVGTPVSRSQPCSS